MREPGMTGGTSWLSTLLILRADQQGGGEGRAGPGAADPREPRPRAGVDKDLFFRDNMMMLPGDAEKMAEAMVKSLG